MFLPTTKKELKALGWEQLDVILVSGDTYVDTPYNGIAIVGKLLVDAGYRVGVIAQPDIESGKDIMRLGEPKLYWGISGGLVDSMVANYTATKKFRKSDDFTPGAVNDRRPDRAVIKYANLIRQHFKDTVPLVLGGVEASLRRVAHYDFWTNKIRRSLLFDAKADVLVYGMAEKSVVELTDAFRDKKPIEDIRGICYIAKEPKEGYYELPSYEECAGDKHAFISMFHHFYANNEPDISKGLCQLHGNRHLIQNPPQPSMTQEEIDHVYDIGYERDVHPYYKAQGEVRGLQTIQFSVTTHHGCYGECNFCAITVHQGRTIRSRSQDSIVSEIDEFKAHKDFKGIINDVGGATANMYGFECDKKLKSGVCQDIPCTSSQVCPILRPDHAPQIELLGKIRKLPHVKKAFVNSGIRYDLIQEDKKHGKQYLKTLVDHHISGQMKVAPEHIDDKVLKLMNKPDKATLMRFKADFDELNRQSGKKQFLTYYLIAAHPGSQLKDMQNLKEFANQELHLNPEQVQVFIPTPSTYSALMYYTEMDPWTREPVFVEKDPQQKQKQKDVVTQKEPFKKYSAGKPQHNQAKPFKKRKVHEKKEPQQKNSLKPPRPINYKTYKTLHKERIVYREE
ncbi:YgiQ family radical SAM protein [Sulfurovum sp. NBC37-1]|uniref:YgiQ family radical SAM protein n=1 Tax=Sulfurovum sp. (strain NBC37-1) TaxID=387093 RepID=UPI0001587CCE|nr:YgiQ family radical SAM protein [Sulfurovum sp. NBC37-1]BAF72582.1 Fe-S oxidoreductase [Sulfurovum sp. NBC37-1]